MLMQKLCLTLLVVCPLIGCTADSASSPLSAADTQEATVASSADEDALASTTASDSETTSETVTKQTASVSSSETSESPSSDSDSTADDDDASSDDASSNDSTSVDTTSTSATEQTATPRELKTADDYLDALREKLDGVAVTPELIAETIALAEEGASKLKDDTKMAVILGDLLYQTVPFEKDQKVLKQRRLRMGELARQIGKSKDFVSLARVLLYEEGKAYLADKDVKKSFASVLEARKLGFSDIKAFYLDPEYADLVNNKEIAPEFKKMIKDAIKEQMAEFKPFDFKFSLTSFDGEKVSHADFKGKPLIVDFWGTWCGPCREVVPHLVKLADKYKDKIAIMGVNLESNRGETPYLESRANFEEFIKIQPINYTCVHGTYAFAETVQGYEGVFPTMYFIDAEGKAVLKGDGYHTLEEIETTIETLLDKKQPKAGA